MAISFVQQANSGDAFSGSPSVSITNTAGNFLIVYSVAQNGMSANTIMDTLGNTFVHLINNVSGGSNASTRLNVWIVDGCKPGANVVTVTTASPQGIANVVAEYSGVDATTPVDVSATSVNASMTPSSPSITTNFANDWIVAAINSFGGGTVGLTQAGYSARFGPGKVGGGSGRYDVVFADSNAGQAVGSYTVGFTNTLTDSGLVTIALKAAYVPPAVYSVPDCRNFGNFPNDSVDVQGTLTYTVPSVDCRVGGAPKDCRKAGPPVDSRVSSIIPENSRNNPPF